MTTSAIESPCVKICVVDPKTDLCTGCYRTLSEIGAWTGMSAAERRVVMDVLPRRRAYAERRPPP